MAYRADVLHLLTRYKRCHMVGAEAHHLVENFHPARHGVRRVHRKRATQDVPLHARKPRVDELPRRNTPGDVRRFHLHHVQVRTDLLVAQNRARFIGQRHANPLVERGMRRTAYIAHYDTAAR